MESTPHVDLNLCHVGCDYILPRLQLLSDIKRRQAAISAEADTDSGDVTRHWIAETMRAYGIEVRDGDEHKAQVEILEALMGERERLDVLEELQNGVCEQLTHGCPGPVASVVGHQAVLICRSPLVLEALMNEEM